MSSLTNLDDSQLLTQMLASLQVTLSFVQNLQDGINADEESNMCEVKQNWQSILSQIEFPENQKEEATCQLSSTVENLSRMFANKALEMAMYKQAIVAKGSDAQNMMKASIDDLMTLKTENKNLRDVLEGKKFEQVYCGTHQQSSSTVGQLAQSFGANVTDGQFKSLGCGKCQELKNAYVACEEQMKEGKLKLEESAIIV